LNIMERLAANFGIGTPFLYISSLKTE